MLIFSILSITLFLFPYLLSKLGYVKAVDYDNPSIFEGSFLFGSALSMFIGLCHIMPPIFVIIMLIALGGMVALGAIFALPFKLAFLRKIAQKNALSRFVASILAATLAIIVYTSLYSYSFGIFIANDDLDTDAYTEAEHYYRQYVDENYADKYKYELAMREMLLPLHLNACYSRVDAICARADQSDEFEEDSGGKYALALFLAWMNGFGAFAFTSQYTKPEKKDETAKFIVG